MGGEAKTGTTEDFKALEAEMNLRHEGMRSQFLEALVSTCVLIFLKEWIAYTSP